MQRSLVKTLSILALGMLMAIGCALLGTTDVFAVLALPFSLAGQGLRWLSFSGTAGNLAAIGLYILLSLLPLLLGLRRKWKAEDWLLPGCCLLLLYVLYEMINPGNRPVVLLGKVGDLVLSGCVYSVLLCWVMIKLVRSSDQMGTADIYQALRIFLWLCITEFAMAMVLEAAGCPAAIAAIRDANTMPGLNLTPTYGFVILSRAASALEYGLDIWVLLLSIRLLRALEADPYGEDCCRTAERVSVWCKRALVIIALSNLALNVLQVAAASALHNLDISFRLSVLSMAVCFTLLALTRLLNQGRELKEDNELFI